MAIVTARPKFRRRQYIVSAKFQLKYTGVILLLMFLTAAMSSYVVYYTSMMMMGEKLANVYPQGQLVHIVKMVNLRLLLSLLFVTPLVAMIGIYLSHKIAGPIFRMERFLNSMASGDVATHLTLRKGDELTGLADGINKVCESIKTSFVDQKGRLNKILDDLAALRSKRADDIGLERIETEVIELLKEVDKYKV
jgi:methyl-accepting chemotaxis protein